MSRSVESSATTGRRKSSRLSAQTPVVQQQPIPPTPESDKAQQDSKATARTDETSKAPPDSTIEDSPTVTKSATAKRGRKRSRAADAQGGAEGSEEARSSTASKRKHADSQGQDEGAEGTPPKKGRKVSGKAARPKKPASTEESTWPESKLDEDRTITAGDAHKLYRITKPELDASGLKYTAKRSRNGGGAFWKPMHLYVERDVERLAWKKHGSPEGWKWYLDKLRATHEKQHPNKPFPHPGQIDERLARAFYASMEGGVYDGETYADNEGDYEYRWDDDCCETCAKIQALFHR